MESIIDIHKTDSTLNVVLQCAFGLRAKKILANQLTPEVTKLRIDLTQSPHIDSEGVIFLHRWLQSGKALEIIHPPAILFEILDILELTDLWDLETIIHD